MVCLVCHTVTRGELCERCLARLRRAPDRILAGGIKAVSAFEHTGPAADLMHALKYRGNELILKIVVTTLEESVGRGHTYVPVPRVWTRYLRYGIDPSRRLAWRLANATGGRILDAIRRPLHNPRLAGAARRGVAPAFSLQRPIGGSIVLVDDVLTTGSTLTAAIGAVGRSNVDFVVTATSARQKVRDINSTTGV